MSARSRVVSSLACSVALAMLTSAASPIEASALFTPDPQGAAAPSAQNTQVVVNGGVVTVTYDLNGPSGQTFDVTLQVSQDGGQTYALLAKTVTGDVGSNVTPGSGKRIVWQASRDTDSLQMDGFRYRVVVVGTPPARRVDSDASQAPRGLGASGGAPPTTAATKIVRPFKWPAVAMMGAGVASIAIGVGPAKDTDPKGCDTIDPRQGAACRIGDDPVANKGLVGLGVGLAGAGTALLLFGPTHAADIPTVVVLPGRVSISKTVTFGRSPRRSQ